MSELREKDLELGKRIIHSMNKNLKLSYYKNVDGIHYHLISSTELMAIVKDLINTPKHETVEQWEKRTGESYPDDAPVWFKETAQSNGEDFNYWKLGTYKTDTPWGSDKNVKSWIDYSKKRSIIANNHGKPEEV